MPTQKTRRVPGPIYAAAGAGDLAYQKLKTLPAKLTELRERVAELSPAVKDTVTEREVRAGVERLRVVARRNATAVVNGAHVAQRRATVVYNGLVARGEKVVEAAKAERAAATGGEGEPADQTAELRAGEVVAEIEATVEPVDQPEHKAPGAAEQTGQRDDKAAKPAAKRARPSAKEAGTE